MLLVVLPLAFQLLGVTMAYPTGAGSCVGGTAAVGGSHLDPSNGMILSGTLTEGQVVVTLDQQTLQSSSTTTSVQTNQEYTLSVTSNNPNGGFRGIFIRMELTPSSSSSVSSVSLESDNNSFITTDLLLVSFVQWDTSITRLADDVCSSESYDPNTVQGLTHVNNDEKKQITSTVRWDAPGMAYIDITIVGANRESIGSVYGYERFPLQVVDNDTSPAPPPTTTEDSNEDIIIGTFSPTYAPPPAKPPTSSSNAPVILLTRQTCLGMVAIFGGWLSSW